MGAFGWELSAPACPDLILNDGARFHIFIAVSRRADVCHVKAIVGPSKLILNLCLDATLDDRFVFRVLNQWMFFVLRRKIH